MRSSLVLGLGLLLATHVAAKAELVVGAVIPLSGASATQGEDQRRGMEIALEEINAAGGVLGKPVKLIVEDSGGRVPSALDAAKKLVTVDSVSAVIGEYSSGITIPIGQYLVQSGKIHLNIGSSSNRIRDLGATSFSVLGLEAVSSKFAAKDVVAQGWKKIVIVGPNNAYGQGMASGVKEELEKLGATVMSTLLYTEGQTTYRRELQQAAQMKPDAFVYSAYGKDAALMNREAFELGINKTPWYAIYLSMCTADSQRETVVGQYGMDLNFVGPNGKAYEEAYRKKYGMSFKTSFSGYGYDALKLLAAAAGKAGSAEPAKLREALIELGKGYEGATGTITFDAGRQRSEQPYLTLKMGQNGYEPR
ncbi:ABC transporter substrate-binding protein [Enterovirga aerilata]|uniref:ABC transporter substrate-binding protein n=1 Tax=Enterovirga aerilata TaxID=2730920 RepID=A0A849I9U5_9HYPH|nr:ABC transporter substrate-binding protein [Enterovirga sp. DB1703]NNM72777.1 ABC transporter substrate-binding protein [Enterovirga sp. DB1703]